MHDLCSTTIASDRLRVVRVCMGGIHATIMSQTRLWGLILKQLKCMCVRYLGFEWKNVSLNYHLCLVI